jgi:hypothetical protein
MSPDVQKRPVALYSDFNPPQISPASRQRADEQSAEYLRKIYRFLVGAAIGGLVGFAIYFLFLM